MLRLGSLLLLCAALATAADLTGTWQLTVETAQGTGTPTMDLKQDGERLTGTFHSQIFGDVAIKGAVNGSQIEFAFEGDAGGAKMKVTYKGVVQSASAMKGTAVYEGFDDKATWSATRK